MKKPAYLKDAVARLNGFYSKKGEKLKSRRLTPEFCDEWNGVVREEVKPAPVVEETVVEEKPKKLFGKKNKTVQVEELGDVFEVDADSAE